MVDGYWRANENGGVLEGGDAEGEVRGAGEKKRKEDYREENYSINHRDVILDHRCGSSIGSGFVPTLYLNFELGFAS